MNVPQRIVLAIGAIAIAAMVTFPPWLFVYHPAGGSSFTERRPAGYHLLFSENVAQDQTQLARLFGLPLNQQLMALAYFSMVIDRDRLAVQLGGDLAITVLLTFLFKSRR